jgi:uncharacterized protein (TIGR02466 family)
MSISIKNIPAFPVYIHEVKDLLKPEHVESLKQTCDNLEYIDSNNGLYQSQDSYLQNDERFKKITLYIRSVLRTIKIAELYDADDFEISQMWVNRARKNACHEQHWHSNSFFSGIFYLTEGSPTVFYDPVIGRQMSSLNVWAETNQPAIVLPAEVGTLRVFPSYFQHKTLPNEMDEDRISISFNSVPVGKVNTRNPYTRLSELSISIAGDK